VEGCGERVTSWSRDDFLGRSEPAVVCVLSSSSSSCVPAQRIGHSIFTSSARFLCWLHALLSLNFIAPFPIHTYIYHTYMPAMGPVPAPKYSSTPSSDSVATNNGAASSSSSGHPQSHLRPGEHVPSTTSPCFIVLYTNPIISLLRKTDHIPDRHRRPTFLLLPNWL
jgi:hypothetical protein